MSKGPKQKDSPPVEPVCPFLSGQVVPLPDNVIPSSSPLSSGTPGMMLHPVKMAPVMVPCSQGRCALWCEEDSRCGLLAQSGFIASRLSVIACHLSALYNLLEPPSNGPSPIGRVAEALEGILEKLQERKVK